MLPEYAETDAPTVVELGVFGIGIRIETNSARVAELARSIHADAVVGRARVRIRICCDQVAPVEEDGVHWTLSTPQGSIRGPGFRANFDLRSAEAVVLVDRDAVERPEFRDSILGGLIYTLIARFDRHPVHAAGLRSAGAALILHGPSGAGKSTLCYVAHGNGMTVLADDVIRVQLEPDLRVWGRRDQILLLDDARERFPELLVHESRIQSAGGQSKLAVDLTSESDSRCQFVTRARVCLLERERGPVRLRPATPEEIFDALVSSKEAQLDQNPERRPHVASALSRPGGWTLRLSTDPRAAIPALRELIDNLSVEQT